MMPDAAAPRSPLQLLEPLAVEEAWLTDSLRHIEVYTMRGLLTLLWHGDPAAAARRGPAGSGDRAVRVELDGRVIAPRGGQGVAGNLLTDPWDAIWAGPALVGYRARLQTPTHCDTCPGLALCAADCPKDPNGWADA